MVRRKVSKPTLHSDKLLPTRPQFLIMPLPGPSIFKPPQCAFMCIKYISYQNKIVPSDYKLTAEDEADKRSGRYVFSYGSDEVEIIDVQLIEFAYQGLNYSMCTFNNSLTRDALVQMAREFIDYQ